MSTNSSWIPDEDYQTLFSERCWLQGVFVNAAVYGMTIPLYILTLYPLMRKKDRVECKYRTLLVIYITTLFLLGTIYMFALAAFTQKAFVDNRNYPGGPDEYENKMFSIPVDNVGNVAAVLINWMCDALLVWRFKVIYQSCRVPLWIVMLLPCLMFACSMATGIAWLFQVTTTSFWRATHHVNFTLPYLSLPLALNAVLTIAIVLRLLAFKYRTVAALGPGYGTQYTSIAAMTIESAALYSTISVTFHVLFKLGNPVAQVCLECMSQFQTIATLLILFRVVYGRGWTEETATYVMAARRSGPLGLGRTQSTSPGASLTLANTEESVRQASEDFKESEHASGEFFILKNSVV